VVVGRGVFGLKCSRSPRLRAVVPVSVYIPRMTSLVRSIWECLVVDAHSVLDIGVWEFFRVEGNGTWWFGEVFLGLECRGFEVNWIGFCTDQIVLRGHFLGYVFKI